MISLYPSHIPIFSHIHIFHIFLYSYFYRFRRLPCHLCFFIFHFCGMKAGCVFLVVFWCRCCGWFSFRSSSRLSTRFLRFAPRFVFRIASRFVCPFGRVGWAVRGTRRFCQLFVAGGRLFSFVSWCRGGDEGVSLRVSIWRMDWRGRLCG